MLDSLRGCLGRPPKASEAVSPQNCIFCNVTAERGFRMSYKVGRLLQCVLITRLNSPRSAIGRHIYSFSRQIAWGAIAPAMRAECTYWQGAYHCVLLWLTRNADNVRSLRSEDIEMRASTDPAVLNRLVGPPDVVHSPPHVDAWT